MQYPLPIVTRWNSPPDTNDEEEGREMAELARMLGASAGSIGELTCKRRRFGRFMGLQGMEGLTSAVDEREDVMREQMERYVQREMAKKEWRDREREAGKWKGGFSGVG